MLDFNCFQGSFANFGSSLSFRCCRKGSGSEASDTGVSFVFKKIEDDLDYSGLFSHSQNGFHIIINKDGYIISISKIEESHRMFTADADTLVGQNLHALDRKLIEPSSKRIITKILETVHDTNKISACLVEINENSSVSSFILAGFPLGSDNLTFSVCLVKQKYELSLAYDDIITTVHDQ